MNIKQKFEENFILGCIKYNDQCSLYLMPIAYWILNYKKYDPTYDPSKWDFVFRNNILIVSDESIDQFMTAIQADKVTSNELTQSEIASMSFYIDFDSKVFVSSFSDVQVEDYLPHDGWQGLYDDLYHYYEFHKMEL
ncbi:hypothetical protein [uncultured Chitinophaga sp.]|jgi:hypothetical protein|uniref:hypothetical protein n=1 Tax=uncultured Chitinophaga sp. TaxID=339340 RepID=UPI00261994F9|nr:hypothetical protein [uncultured Chitinophaga sp.]